MAEQHLSLCPGDLPQAELCQELREDRQTQRIPCFWQGSNSCSYRQFGAENHYLPKGKIRLSKTAEGSLLLKRPEEEGVIAPAEHKRRGISVFLQFLFVISVFQLTCANALQFYFCSFERHPTMSNLSGEK